MAKRRNDQGQLSKEDYDALESREVDESSNAGSFKASNEVISRRRMVKVDRSKWKNKRIGTLRTPSAATPAPALTPTNVTSNNPFATTSFASAVTKSTSIATEPPANSNPFAGVSFASTPVNANKPMGFGMKGPIATSTKKPEMTKKTFAFTSSGIGSDGSTDAGLPPLRLGAKDNEVISMNESEKSNMTMLRMAKKEAENNPLSDYTPWLKKYVAKHGDNTATATGSGSGSGAKEIASASTFKKDFSFAPDPSPAKTPDASSTPSFSFSSTPAPAAEPKPFTGFSFATPSAAAPTSISSPAPVAVAVAPASDTNDASNADEDADATVIERAVDEDEDEVYSCRAKYLRMVDKEWKTFAANELRLYRNKKNGTCKIVQRDDMGRVRLNLIVAKGMPVNMIPRKENARTQNIQILSVMDEEIGPEQFILRTSLDVSDGLFKNLKSLAE